MQQLVFRGNVDGRSSYNFHLENVVRGFVDLGVFVSIHPVQLDTSHGVPSEIFKRLVHQDQPARKEVVIHDPTFDAAGETGKEVCYVTMWETTRLPEPAVENLNRAKVVVVPSKWQAEVFSAQGVSTPLRVVPMGAEPIRFPYEYREHSGPYTFGTVGRLAFGGCRKNIEGVIAAFKKIASADVRLAIKTYPGEEVPEIDDSRISVSQEFVSRKDVPKFYQQIDCFVSATRGEGWGLCQHEAMLSGKPVISPAFGGISEFFDPSVGFAVPYTLQEAGKHYANCGLWASPDVDHLSAAMESLSAKPDIGAGICRAARERMLEFSWEASNRKLKNVLEEFGFLDG